MQFLVIGYDGKDKNALKRRLAVRAEHIALGNKLKKQGNILYGVAILNKNKKMIGSIYICNFPSRKKLNKWLEKEPYIIGNVWKKIEIKPCQVGPSFNQ